MSCQEAGSSDMMSEGTNSGPEQNSDAPTLERMIAPRPRPNSPSIAR